MRDNYFRYCRLARVVDSNTILLQISLGFHIVMQHSIRLFGVSAVDKSSEKEQSARKFIVEWFRDHKHNSEDRFSFLLESHKADNFGRFLGHVKCSDDHALNADIVSAGLAIPFEKLK